MKKTIISLLLVLAMVLSFALVAAPAAEATAVHPHDDATQTHCSCGKAVGSAAITGHTHAASAVTWKEWSGIGNVEDNGHYYLTKDYNYSEGGNPLNWGSGDKNFTLCLNGYSITQEVRITVRGQMTICDCSTTPGTITTYTNNSGASGGVASVYSEGDVFNLFNANLVHAAGMKMKNGGGVYIYAGATFNMYSGSVSGGSAISEGDGGNVYVCANAAFNMYGGLISNSRTDKTAKNGSNIYSKGNVYITGNSVIEGGKATFGGGARIDGGTFTMDGGEIRNGVASNGGNLFVHSANVYVKGTAVIKEGNATLGGNVTVRKSTANDAFYLQENAKIIDGVAATAGANVYCHDVDASTFHMSGGAVVNGAIKNGGAGTISITGGFLELAEDFTTEEKITINAANDLIIDLNGKVLSGAVNAGDKKLSIVDSTAAVAGAGTGKLEATVTGTMAQGQALPSIASELAGKRYVTIDGVAHRIYIGIENVQLSMNEETNDIGMSYTTNFQADAAVLAKLANTDANSDFEGYAFGYRFGQRALVKAYGFDKDGFKAKVTANIGNVLDANKSYDENRTAYGTQIWAQTFISLDLGGAEPVVIESNPYKISLEDVVQKMLAIDSNTEDGKELPAAAKDILTCIEGDHDYLFVS